MHSNFTDLLNQFSSSQNRTVQSYIIKNQKVWLKKASERHSGWVYIPLRWVAALFRLHMLAPVPNKGGMEAILCEISRIKELQKLGIRVPQILAESKSAILLEDAANNGQSRQLDQALMAAKNKECRLEIFNQAVAAIQDVHSKNAYLSEAFSRNILVDQKLQFSFIDFETDPGEVLSLRNCQIRDWLCFIFSTAYRLEENELQEASQFLYEQLSDKPKIYHEICRVGHKLHWSMFFKVEKLGNDGQRVKKCMLFLQKLALHQPLPMI
ncbi:lipopolysaccharide kinase InaA family protein [Acinetobacter chinensis]|uniref:Lipopolysaccharide kinase InaA family protein n=1 Tax=Acinetobacter chinensis TaxID=2004650 RepID=A0ABU3WHZ9_9GAMM|nr:lipopolysaccharide kinase InaA family protein [Acinetobacter chinensis]MDV2470031.1 lipopolysaccharide kinase InaA family protein [Acinetobacter chinensis]